MKIYTKIFKTQADFDAAKDNLKVPCVVEIKETGESKYIFKICDNDTDSKFMEIAKNAGAVSDVTEDLTNINILKITDLNSVLYDYDKESMGALKWCKNVTNFEDSFDSGSIKYVTLPKVEANCNTMFLDADNLKSVKAPYLKPTACESMFSGCASVESIDVGNWDMTGVNSINGMFSSCPQLTNLDVSNWDTSNITNMGSVFSGCNKLGALDVSKWDVSKVTTLKNAFKSCKNLGVLDVSNWDVNKVTDFSQAFCIMSNIKTLDVSKWTTNSATNFANTFALSNMELLDMSKFNMSNVTTISGMCDSSQNTKIVGVDKWNVSKITSMNRAFAFSGKDSVFDLTHWVPTKCTQMDRCFINSYATDIDMHGTSWPVLTTINQICQDTPFVNTIDMRNVSMPKVRDTQSQSASWFGWSRAKHILFDGASFPLQAKLNWVFYYCSRLQELDLTNVTFSTTITDVSHMVQGCSAMTSYKDALNMKPTDATQAFAYCSRIEDLDLRHWNMSTCTSVKEMFMGCHSLKTVDIRTWDWTKMKSSSSCLAQTTINATDYTPWQLHSLIGGSTSLDEKIFENYASLMIQIHSMPALDRYTLRAAINGLPSGSRLFIGKKQDARLLQEDRDVAASRNITIQVNAGNL